MTPNELEKFEKVTYVALEEEPLTWWEWFFGRSEPEIEADSNSKKAKYKVTEQIKSSAKTHKLIDQKPQTDIPFHHTQSVVETGLKMEDKTNVLPSPYKTPVLAPQVSPATILNTMTQKTPVVPQKKSLHPSIVELRKQRFKTAKDDLDI